MVWDAVVVHSKDKRLINKAVNWMQIILKSEHYSEPQSIDTYANLLYKLGRRREAVKWEKKAMQINPKENAYKETATKMLAGRQIQYN